MLILSNCVKRIHRWYEAIHQAILNIELHKLSICGTIENWKFTFLCEFWKILFINWIITSDTLFARQNDGNLKDFLRCRFKKAFKYPYQSYVTVFIHQTIKPFFLFHSIILKFSPLTLYRINKRLPISAIQSSCFDKKKNYQFFFHFLAQIQTYRNTIGNRMTDQQISQIFSFWTAPSFRSSQ